MGNLLNIQAITTAAGDLSRFVPYGEIVKQDEKTFNNIETFVPYGEIVKLKPQKNIKQYVLSFVPYGEIVKQQCVIIDYNSSDTFVPYGEIVKQEDVESLQDIKSSVSSPMGKLLNCVQFADVVRFGNSFVPYGEIVKLVNAVKSSP